MTHSHNPHSRTRRRKFLAATLLCVVGSTLPSVPMAVAATDSANKPNRTKMKIKGLYPPDAPAADIGYSPGILVEGKKLLFISGQGPRDLNADMETQIRQTLERIRAIVEQAGGSMKNIVILRSYFVHLIRDLPIYRKVRREYLVKPYPASTAVGVSELATPQLQIEIEAVAVL
jgi:enamine deaminase RidA (YjgF/YER057c/UK114 family)